MMDYMIIYYANIVLTHNVFLKSPWDFKYIFQSFNNTFSYSRSLMSVNSHNDMQVNKLNIKKYIIIQVLF